MKRKQFNDVWIGANGSGKTHKMKELALLYSASNNLKRCLFVLPDDGEESLWKLSEIEKEELVSFEGIKKLILDDENDFEFITDTFKPFINQNGEKEYRRFNGLMLCDDLGTMINRRPKHILRLFKRRRQPNIDFIWSFHGLKTDVPPSFYTYVNRIVLFRTSDAHEYTMQQLPEHKRNEFLEIYKRVQHITETEPHYCEELILNPLSI